MNEISRAHRGRMGLLDNRKLQPAETIIDMTWPVQHGIEQLNDFICSPLDTPKGLGRGYFFSLDDH